MGFLERRIGSRRIFAVEFEVEPDLKAPVNEWWGSLWLWADGRCIGESQEVEMVSIGMDALVWAAHKSGSRVSPHLSSLDPNHALDVVMETIYGAEGEPAGSENLTAFDILPTSAGPFFDDWEAILLEEGENERFIYRRIGLPVCEARWKLGTFKDIVLRANFELREIGGSDRDQTKGLQ